eukprot:scaffold344732_cov20-Attheya_sp.AAC.1
MEQMLITEAMGGEKIGPQATDSRERPQTIMNGPDRSTGKDQQAHRRYGSRFDSENVGFGYY